MQLIMNKCYLSAERQTNWGSIVANCKLWNEITLFVKIKAGNLPNPVKFKKYYIVLN